MALIDTERDSWEVIRAEDAAIAAAESNERPPLTALDELARLLADDDAQDVHQSDQS